MVRQTVAAAWRLSPEKYWVNRLLAGNRKIGCQPAFTPRREDACCDTPWLSEASLVRQNPVDVRPSAVGRETSDTASQWDVLREVEWLDASWPPVAPATAS